MGLLLMAPSMRKLRFKDGLKDVSFDDERQRSDKLGGRIASVTLSNSKDQTSWGEFFAPEEIALLHEWTGALLRKHFDV